MRPMAWNPQKLSSRPHLPHGMKSRGGYCLLQKKKGFEVEANHITKKKSLSKNWEADDLSSYMKTIPTSGTPQSNVYSFSQLKQDFSQSLSAPTNLLQKC